MMLASICNVPYADFLKSAEEPEIVSDPSFLHEVFLVQAQGVRMGMAKANLNARVAARIADAFGALWAMFAGVLPRDILPFALRQAVDVLQKQNPPLYAKMLASQRYLAPQADDEEALAEYKDALDRGHVDYLTEVFFRRYGMGDTSVSRRVSMMFLTTMKGTTDHLNSLAFNL